jgi:formylglycine-generating enzyme required for sulfatase activity
MKRALVTLVGSVFGCSLVPVPTTQVLLHVDTDAIVPALFDRLRIDVLPPGVIDPCAACTTDIAPTADELQSSNVSVGIPVAANTTGYRVRVRLFKAAFVGADGQPPADISIDTTLALPPVDDTATTDVTAVLMTDTLGTPQGTPDAPIDAVIAAPSASLVSTWSGGQRVDCTTKPKTGEVCVPGGAFWMGDPRVFQLYGGVPTHLVVVSPFLLAATETTVQAYRAYGNAQPWSGDPTGDTLDDYCTFTTSGTTNADLPVNCMEQPAALAYCKTLGADLPTEAQLEYAGSALGVSSFVWGEDVPSCADAVYARGGWVTASQATEAESCKPTVAMNFVLPAGSTARDHLQLEGGTLHDLAGNLSEWTKDTWQSSGESCWSPVGILTDPVCTTTSTIFPADPAKGRQWVVRGGSWSQDAAELQAAFRLEWWEHVRSSKIGVRCARPGQ